MAKFVAFTRLDEDSTEPHLYSNIERTFPNTRRRQHTTREVRAPNIVYTPYLQNKMLQAETQTISTNGNRHNTVVQLLDVQFGEGPTKIATSTGQEISFTPFAANSTNVKVRCDCLDFRFRFADWNHSDNSLVGSPPPPYIRKTTTRPPANPLQTPGFCRHVIKVFEDMRRQGIIA